MSDWQNGGIAERIDECIRVLEFMLKKKQEIYNRLNCCPVCDIAEFLLLGMVFSVNFGL